MKNYLDVENNNIDTEEEYYQREFINNTFTEQRLLSFKKSLNDYKYFPENNICNFKHRIIKNEFDDLREKYPYEEIIQLKSDFDKAVAVLTWMSNHSYYYGYSKLKSRNSVEIIEKYFDKGFRGAINCGQQSTVLADILCSLGIYARRVMITVNVVDKQDEFYGDGNVHVVVHAYIKELCKWVMFDPSYTAYFADTQGNIMNLIDLREAYNTNEDIIVPQYKLNGSSERFRDSYIERISVMNFRIEIGQNNTAYQLIPERLDFKDYIMYMYRNKSEEERVSVEKEVDEYEYISSLEFLSIPDNIIS